MVTVETAIGLAGVVSVVAALILALSVGATKAEVCQVAREAARSHSIGQTYDSSSAATRTQVTVDVGISGEWVTATASAPAVSVASWSSPSVACAAKTIREAAYAGG